jgi:hypothetical protein
MTKLILSVLAASATASFAGTAMVQTSSSKGQAPPPPKMASPCPNYLTYNEVQLSYVHLDGDSAGKANGADLRVHYSLLDGVFAYGDITSLSGDFDNTGLDLGLGGYIPVASNLHVIGRAGYSYFDTDEDNSNGWHVAAGLRAQLGCNLELNAKAEYGDLVDFEDGSYWAYGVGATWHINEAFAIVSEYVFGQDDTWSIRGGVVFKF